jgi:hypothetical protein
MVRALSLGGFGALFLMISPGLRAHVVGAINATVAMLERNSPYSYVICALGLFAVFTISLNRGAQPR